MAFLLGFIPTVRGVIMLCLAGAIGTWLGGARGAETAVTGVVAVAFLKPNLSMWLESVLFAARGVCGIVAAFKALLAFGPVGRHFDQLPVVLLFAGVAVIAHIRIVWLVRRGDLCPMALGTTRLA